MLTVSEDAVARKVHPLTYAELDSVKPDFRVTGDLIAVAEFKMHGFGRFEILAQLSEFVWGLRVQG